jgi:capsular exopolysaccharide synthesis family protein
VAFIVAFIDDRVKSAHDIEAVIGLPLLGAIPRIKKLNSSEKAQVSASNTDRGASEAFRSILSSIKLSHIGKTAKIILSTSTTPSEGKSFVLSNIAFTSAIHGEKVLVIDADLRLPAIAKVLGIESDKGLIAYTEGRATFEQCVVREYFPNMDVLPCEKRVSTPTQILNSDAFIGLLQDLRNQYDKIYIDTPPIGAVSDAIALLPYVDGIIYVIKYNAIKRKVIKGYVRKLLDSNVPILGAVMNMVNASSSQSYTSNYYNKSYKNYYLAGDDDFEEVEGEGNPPQAS